MIKKAAAVMAVVTMLVAGPVMNHVTAEAADYNFSITTITQADTAHKKTKTNNLSTCSINIKSGVISGSLHVSARLVRKNANGYQVNAMSALMYTSNGTQTGKYASGDGLRGEDYFLAAKVNESSRFNSTDLVYNFQP